VNGKQNQLYAVCLTVFGPGGSTERRMEETGFVFRD